MRLTAFLLLIFSLSLSARTSSQMITFAGRNVSFQQLFSAIKTQTGYLVTGGERTFRNSVRISVDVKEMELNKFLNLILENRPYEFEIKSTTIFIKRKSTFSSHDLNNKVSFFSSPPITIRGKIVNENGEPVVASVVIKGTNRGVTSDLNGYFELLNVDEKSILMISAMNIESVEMPTAGIAKNSSTGNLATITISVKTNLNPLDEIVFKGYYTESKRLSTGSVGKVTSAQIEKQPVTNLVATLQGRIPGVVITQNSGVPGSGFSVQIRGQNSLFSGVEPLYIIDGVPFMQARNTVQLSNMALSPFNSINTADIESIEILKDAVATAIYGSQGANGVVLVTTKKARAGKTKLDVNVYHGIGEAGRTVPLLNTEQYLAMRKEAFVNDDIIPTAANAPDLFIWDSTKYTDWKEMMIGGTSTITNVQASLSGGNANTRFLFSTSYNNQNTVYPGDKQPNQRGTSYLNVSHGSANNKFKATISVNYSIDNRKLPVNDLMQFVYLPPNAPDPYDSLGNLNWTGWIQGVEHPTAQLFRKYKNESTSLLSDLVLEYKFFRDLKLSANVGYRNAQTNEERYTPIKSKRPSPTNTGESDFHTNTFRGWIIEPQLNYARAINKAKIELLAGMSFQERRQSSISLQGAKYSNDDFLENIQAAGQITAKANFAHYKYDAAYGHMNANWENKYILNASIRRDGSSRFGPASRFSTFSAVGAAWIFSKESFAERLFPFLHFGKIKSSYGITGNDQIGDYSFLDAWVIPLTGPYDGEIGLIPDRLFNPYLQWEKTKKIEIGIDLGLFKDNIQLSVVYFQNRSDNQLVGYSIPGQTGFSSISSNLDASLKNYGNEFELFTRNITTKSFQWTTSFNISFPKSKLISYPGLEQSSNRFTYAIGEPLNVNFAYQYNGIDPATGVYIFEDVNNNGAISSGDDLKIVGTRGPSYYGGLQNSLKLKNWEFSALFQFAKQTGRNYLSTMPAIPGSLSNQPDYVLQRWQKQGDEALIQKFTANTVGTAYAAYLNYRNSSGAITNASFIRLKNISLYYNFASSLVKKWKLENLRVYTQAQNLLTLTNYNGADPETQNLLSLPPLKIITAGIQITF